MGSRCPKRLAAASIVSHQRRSCRFSSSPVTLPDDDAQSCPLSIVANSDGRRQRVGSPLALLIPTRAFARGSVRLGLWFNSRPIHVLTFVSTATGPMPAWGNGAVERTWRPSTLGQDSHPRSVRSWRGSMGANAVVKHALPSLGATGRYDVRIKVSPAFRRATRMVPGLRSDG